MISLSGNSSKSSKKYFNIFNYLQHLNNISALDWHPKTDLLLSASTDRGVLVWAYDAQFKGLIPGMANVKETKANIDASWNHRGDKFCVGAASGKVFIGTFSKANNFWIGQTLSKIKSIICIQLEQK